MSKQKKKSPASVTVNRRARYDYALSDESVCGLVLSGPEVRLIRDHHVQLKGSFVTIRYQKSAALAPKTRRRSSPTPPPVRPELWLNNLTLGSETARNLKLLATKKQIAALEKAKQDGSALVPTKLLAGGRYIKLAVAIGKGKKKYDKRQSIKSRDLDRDAHRGNRW